MSGRAVLFPILTMLALSSPALRAQARPAGLPAAQKGPVPAPEAGGVPDVPLNDSPRFDDLIRNGKLNLSLRDAIALAIENNLDIQYQRLTPAQAEADLLRARAGGVSRGITTNILQGPAGVGGGSAAGTSATTGANAGAPGQGQISQAADTTTNFSTSSSLVSSGGQTGSGPGVPSLDPTIAGSAGRSVTNRPQASTFITGTNSLTTGSTLGDIRIQQGFLFGGTAALGLDLTRQNTNNLRSDINPATSGGLSFTLTQPLLRGFGIAVNNRFIRIAKNNRRVSDLVFEQQVISTVYTVARLYWDLVSLYGEYNVQQQSLDLAQRLLDENVQQLQAGTLAPIDVVRTRAQVAAARRDLTLAETRLRQQENILKDYLTRRSVAAQNLAAVRVVPTDSITLPDVEPVRPLDDLVQEARRRRPELKQSEMQVENARISLTGSKNALLPELDLVAGANSNALFGRVSALPPAVSSGSGAAAVRHPDPTFIGGAGTGFSQIFGARFPDYSLALQLNIPILNRLARADYARDRLSLAQQEIRSRQLDKQIAVEVLNALTALEQSRAALAAAEESRRFQEQALEAERERYRVGASTNYLIIQYQRDLAAAQSAEVAARSDYAIARATLDRATGALLEKNGVSIEDAYAGRAPGKGGPPSK